jgi:hypothetical protein
MAYDQELAKRMWRLIGSDPDLTEKKMSGELAFLIRGNMAIAASSQGGAVVRVDPRQSAALIAGLQPELRRCAAGQFRADCMSAPMTWEATTISPPGRTGASGTRGHCRQSGCCGSGRPSARPPHHARPERALCGM